MGKGLVLDSRNILILVVVMLFVFAGVAKFFIFNKSVSSGPLSQSNVFQEAIGEVDLSCSGVLFRSGFEEPVYLEEPKYQGNNWVQFLRGNDQGFEWAKDLLGESTRESYFTYLIGESSNPSDFVKTDLVNVVGYDGKSTRALYMEFIEDDSSDRGSTRNQYSVYPSELNTQGYVRYRMKLQPDLEEIMPSGVASYRMLMEWKEGGPAGERADYRWNIGLARHSGGSDQIHWQVRSEFGDLKDSPVDWQYKSYEPVPIGEWFLFEVFWKQHETDGRVLVVVDGKVIFDHHGRTKKDSPVHVWWPFKVYPGSDREITKRGSLYQWIDDVEFCEGVVSD